MAAQIKYKQLGEGENTQNGLTNSPVKHTSGYSYSNDFRVKTMPIRLDSHLCCRGFVFYLYYLYLFTYTGVQHDFHIRLCSYRLTVTRRVSHL